ncbi:sigma 54-interacting transcriptional regulator [Lachnospiraceae bacterium 62-35]
MELNFENLWAVLESVPDGVLIVDRDYHVVMVNSTYCKMFHETKEKIVGTNYLEFNKNSLLPSVMKTAKPLVNISYKSEACIHEYTGPGLYVTLFPVMRENELIGVCVSYREINTAVEAAQRYERLAKRYGNSLRIQHKALYVLDHIIGECADIVRTKREIERIGRGDAPVFLWGESGTGKEIFASALHNVSSRASEPFVAVNCPSLPESLAESELFGYESGAFSGALKGGKIGFFEIADGGTIFLDEIGDLSLELQAKILRVLESGEFFRIGGIKPIKVNFRLVSATNRNLEEMIREGKFREDLYFRLSVVTVHIPPLRKRGKDILTLAEYFITQIAAEKKILSEEVKQSFLHYTWPGNVRQLKNTITTMINFSDHDILTMDDLPKNFMDYGLLWEKKDREKAEAYPKFLSDHRHLSKRQMEEADKIHKLLDKYGYSVHSKRCIAEEMGFSLATLYNKMQQYGIGK